MHTCPNDEPFADVDSWDCEESIGDDVNAEISPESHRWWELEMATMANNGEIDHFSLYGRLRLKRNEEESLDSNTYEGKGGITYASKYVKV